MSQTEGSDAPEGAAAKDDEAGWGGFVGHVRNYLLGGVVGGVVGFGTVSVLTRLLTPAEYGVFKVWMAFVVVLAVLVELNFRGALSRYYLEETDDFPDFLKTILRFLLGLSAFNLGVAWLLREPMGDFLDLDPSLFVLAAVAAVAQVPWNLNWKLMVSKLESGAFSSLKVLRQLLIFGVGALWVASLPETEPADGYGGRELGQVYGFLAVNLLFALLLSAKLLRIAAKGRARKHHLTYALAFGVPLIPHALSGQILSAFDRVIINQIDTEEAAGLYSFAYDVGAIMSMVVHAMNSAWLPLFTRSRNREQYGRIDAMARAYVKYVSAIAVALVMYSREIASILADARYAEALAIVPVVVLSYMALFMYTIYSNHSFFRKKTALISAATLVAGVVNVVLNYWLIPDYGYAIAAWTTLWSYLLLFVLHYVIARFVLGERVARLSRLTLWYAAAGLVSWLFVLAEHHIDDYLTTLLAVKLPMTAVIIWWVLRTRHEIDAALKVDI